MTEDNTAVRWSDYEAHRREVEQSVRQSIFTAIQTQIDFCSKNGTARDFIQGMETAQKFVLGSKSVHTSLDQPTLF